MTSAAANMKKFAWNISAWTFEDGGHWGHLSDLACKFSRSTMVAAFEAMLPFCVPYDLVAWREALMLC
jgi:hypothetical protein